MDARSTEFIPPHPSRALLKSNLSTVSVSFISAVKQAPIRYGRFSSSSAYPGCSLVLLSRAERKRLRPCSFFHSNSMTITSIKYRAHVIDATELRSNKSVLLMSTSIYIDKRSE
jgi:hypothetical protein